jgi:hypothetical protein
MLFHSDCVDNHPVTNIAIIMGIHQAIFKSIAAFALPKVLIKNIAIFAAD